MPLPQTNGPSQNLVSGFEIAVTPATVEDLDAPDALEQAALLELCSNACNAHFAGAPGQAATCDAPGAFLDPVHVGDGMATAMDLMLVGDRHGEGLFPPEVLGCDLGNECYSQFDENLARSNTDRATPAAAALAVGEEYRVALGTGSTIEIDTGLGTYSSALTGSIGYSFCEGGNASSACPFYLGSLEAASTSIMTVSLKCEDETTAQAVLSNLSIELGQPAFGIAARGTTSKAFPAGALILETAFYVGSQHFETRRTVRDPVTFSALGVDFSATNLPLSLEVPCNQSKATVNVMIDLVDPGGPAIARPPTVAITVPSTIQCGNPIALTASVNDPDGDLLGVRWFIDDVLIAPEISTIVLNKGHQLRAVARDARGAATTARRVVSCQ